MKLFKLIVHQKNFSAEDLIINPKDFPTVKKGDIVEIYHLEDETSRLLLQITAFKEEFQTRETISVEQTIASTFQLRLYHDVVMNVVSAESVALDSLELTFKDQYMGRSEMWRLKNSLVNTCVYLHKKLEFCGGSIRCQVYEMWSQGDLVACGVITEDTKIVFRSNTSMVYLFLQMSSEMWDFDVHGDLYFEKAVNGFLADLFHKWKKNGSFHEVTIVLFSRTFYEAQSLDQFPQYMRQCLQQDYKGRFYEDFYRVAVQNERYEEWGSTLVQLRRLFTEYHTQVVEYHKREGVTIPTAVNSTAAQGNFLEVLNMSLNVFEKHYLDRSFDRTGQLSVVITPGVGVFEVDRQVTNVTKQRIIDNGVGSDLVCVGEQPLHAVPLLKFHNKDSENAVDDYSMPHWINLSFYSTNKKLAHCNFTPRIKLPPKILHLPPESPKLVQDDEFLPNSVFDYDAYDNEVFQLPSHHSTKHKNLTVPQRRRLPLDSKHVYEKGSVTLDGPDPHRISRKLSDPDIHHMPPLTALIAPPSSPAPRDVMELSLTEEINRPLLVGSPSNHAPIDIGSPGARHSDKSVGSPVTRHPEKLVGSPDSHITIRPSRKQVVSGRALINPFDPSHVTIKLTSNRRRWTHIFPKGPTGVLIQQHHYQAVPSRKLVQSSATDGRRSRGMVPAPAPPEANKTLLWGATGEQEWTPALTTGVDWKSLTIPACLPITTDYFPDERSLHNDYLVSIYDLLPDDVNADFAQQRAIYKKPLSTGEVFKELVSQRLAQGFQLIVLPCNGDVVDGRQSSLVRSTTASEHSETYLLSIGRIFHKITLTGSSISVDRYRPRHPYPPYNIQYRYRFQAPDHPTYEMSWVSFTTEKLENYSWNYLDHYICTRGDTDFPLHENLKYWRFRVYLLPLSWNANVTRSIMDGADHCDMYLKPTLSQQIALLETFLRYVETWMNKVKRPTGTHKKPRVQLQDGRVGPGVDRRRHSTALIALTLATNQSSTVGSSPYRDRLGSFRLPDKPRPRSGSKVMERGRMSPGDLTSLNSTDSGVFDDGDENFDFKLKHTSPLNEIVEAMKNSQRGVGLFAMHAGLPSQTFTSADAVMWLVNHVDGVTDGDGAILIMDAMLKERLICHASGDNKHPFIIGLYLYHICDNGNNPDGEYTPPLGDLHSFQNEWMEIEVRHPTNWRKLVEEAKEVVPGFLAPILENHCHDNQHHAYNWPNSLYRQVHLEMDVPGKSDRVEWGHCRYQSLFSPIRAYELVVQWEAASGSIVADLISGWARKAQACGLQMIPLPGNPLALPFASKSDPLRGPVFIPLDVECLKGPTGNLFHDFPEDTWPARLVLLQEAIVQRFGFIPSVVENRKSDPEHHDHRHQYVHLTGNIFILIPSQQCSRGKELPFPVESGTVRRAGSRYPLQPDVAHSQHEEYITRHVNGHNGDHDGPDNRHGFLWFWNHMVSKRWRSSSTPATGDENFQNKMLQDFREFCSNTDNRLVNFWDESHVQNTS